MVNWYNKLSMKGWMAPNWPKKYGGTDWTLTHRNSEKHLGKNGIRIIKSKSSHY